MKTAIQIAIENIDQCLNADDTKDMLINLLEKEKEQIMKAYKDHHDLGHIFGLDTEQYFNQTYNN
jgi:hypothetical protein